MIDFAYFNKQDSLLIANLTVFHHLQSIRKEFAIVKFGKKRECFSFLP
jgi:hypothetical protein